MKLTPTRFSLPGRLGALTALTALGVLTGCATQPLPPDERSAVVTRTPSTTVWATPEAEAAAKAQQEAAAAAAAARRQGNAQRAAGRPAPAAPPAATPAASTVAAVAAPASPSPSPTSAAAPLPPEARSVQFAFDSYELEPGFLTLLEAHAAAMKAQPALRVVVEGHADERGGSEYNLALGQKRAEAVVKALALLGVAPERLEAVSFGDTRPVDLARTPEAWAKNRRAELRLP
jgi:peptidoglycan-associated lipoprotein